MFLHKTTRSHWRRVASIKITAFEKDEKDDEDDGDAEKLAWSEGS